MHIAKRILQKASEEGSDWHLSLLEYRNTPIPGLNFSPAEILMSRMCRTRIPMKMSLLAPRLAEGIREKLIKRSQRAKYDYDKNSTKRSIDMSPGDNIVYQKNGRWEKGRILSSATRPRSFKTSDNKTLQRNT